MARALITMPKTAKRGEIVEIRTLIAHPMETGYRPGENGATVPRDILRRFTCRYADAQGEVEVFRVDLFPAIAANPFVSFSTVATSTGTLRFTWEGDHGFTQTESVALQVT